MIPEHTHWQTKANCCGQNPDLFFPESYSTGPGRRQVEIAKLVCNKCVVKVECLEFAFKTNDKYAILGGRTPGEREAAKSDRAKEHKIRLDIAKRTA